MPLSVTTGKAVPISYKEKSNKMPQEISTTKNGNLYNKTKNLYVFFDLYQKCQYFEV